MNSTYALTNQPYASMSPSPVLLADSVYCVQERTQTIYKKSCSQDFHKQLKFPQKTLAEVFGERVLRPTIDKSFGFIKSVASYARGAFTAFDKAISFLPVAMAEESSRSVKLYNHVLPNNNAAVWAGIGVDPGKYNSFIDSLDQDTKIVILKDSKIQSNYLQIHGLISSISRFVADMGINYEKVSQETYNGCSKLLNLRQGLTRAIQKDSTSPLMNIFSPTPETPKNIVLNINIKDRSVDISLKDVLNKQSFFVGKMFNNNIQEHGCSANPVEAALIAELLQKGAILRSLNINDPEQMTYDQFKLLFGDDVVSHLDKHTSELKEALQKGSIQIKRIMDKYIQNAHNSMLNEIVQLINQLYSNHLVTCQNTNLGKERYTLRMESGEDVGYAASWKIYKITPGRIYGKTKEFVFGLAFDVKKNGTPSISHFRDPGD